VRTGLNDVKIGDIDREADLTILRRRFEARSDARDEILDVRQTLENIRDNIDRALELGDAIAIDGEIPDFPDWFERVTALETLRERLTNPDGSLLDAQALAIRLAEFQNQFVTQEQFDEGLESVRSRPPQDLIDALQEDLQSFVNERLASELSAAVNELDERFVRQDDFSSRLDSLANEILAQTNDDLTQALADLDQRFINQDALEARLDQQAEGLRQEFTESISGEVSSQMDAALSDFEKRFVTPTQLNSRLGTFYEETEGRLMETLKSEMTEMLDAAFEKRLESFTTREAHQRDIEELWAAIEELQSRVDSGGSGVSLAELDRTFVSEGEFKERIAMLEQRLLERLEEQIRAIIEEVLGERIGGIRNRVEALTGLESRLNTVISNQIGGLRQELDAISRRAVQNELQGVRTSLSTLESTVNVLRNRIGIRLREEVNVALDEATRELQADLNVVKRRVASLITHRSDNDLRGGDVIDVPPTAEPPVDNLVEIDGLGDIYMARLLDKGIRTFAQLAALSDEELAAILETTTGNVARWEIQAQAADKAQG